MYFLDNIHKFIIVIVLVVGYSIGWGLLSNERRVAQTEIAAQQFEDGSDNGRRTHAVENHGYAVGWGIVFFLTFLIFMGDLRRMLKSFSAAVLLFCVLGLTGCVRPFEPVKLEVVGSNEEAFLLPFLGDSKKQTSSNNEEYLKSNLVYGKQIKIPQQWVPKGYEWLGPNGVWQDAAVLIKVDKSPVTREWTADPTSGTSNKNEAVWVMTSDGVEWSTGWTITARIASRDDAVKFLHNYPNGALKQVCDTEVRSKLQSTFGLEITDQPMSKLRTSATPHILSTVKTVTAFFKERGIEITNLGITGGFVYKDPTIMATLVKVLNAEQQKAISAAELAAQTDINKKSLSLKETEAEGIKLVADAKYYELEKSKENLADYLQLKQLELQKELIARWSGNYPQYYMMTEGGSSTPMGMLQLPPLQKQVAAQPSK